MPNQSGKIVLVLILFLLLIGAALYFLSPFLKTEYAVPISIYSPNPEMNNKEVSTSSASMKDYYSDSFKMRVVFPENFDIEDNFPIFVFSDGVKKINIVRNGTNFDTLAEYIKNFDAKRKVKELNRLEKIINNYPVIEREIIYDENNAKQKSIYLYADNFVYIFSTSDEALYPVLDQIVQSFQYKP